MGRHLFVAFCCLVAVWMGLCVLYYLRRFSLKRARWAIGHCLNNLVYAAVFYWNGWSEGVILTLVFWVLRKFLFRPFLARWWWDWMAHTAAQIEQCDEAASDPLDILAILISENEQSLLRPVDILRLQRVDQRR